MDSSTIDKSELSSIIRYGAEAIFESDENAIDIDQGKFEDEDIDKLVDREALVKEEELASIAEEASKTGVEEGTGDPEALSKPGSFSFAKVWTLDKDVEQESATADVVMDNNPSAAASTVDLTTEVNAEQQEEFWEKLLKDSDEPGAGMDDGVPTILGKRRGRTRINYSESSKRVKKALAAVESDHEDDYEPAEDSDVESQHEEGPQSPVFDPETGGRRKMSKAATQSFPRSQSHSYPQQQPRYSDYQPRQTDDFSCWICGPDSYYHTPLQCPMIFDTIYLEQLKKRMETDYSQEKDKIRLLGAMLRMDEVSKRQWVQIPPDDSYPPVGLSKYLDTAPPNCLFCQNPYHSFSNCPKIFSDPHGTIVRLNELEASGVIPTALAQDMRDIVRGNMAPARSSLPVKPERKGGNPFEMSSLLSSTDRLPAAKGYPRNGGTQSSAYEGGNAFGDRGTSSRYAAPDPYHQTAYHQPAYESQYNQPPPPTRGGRDYDYDQHYAPPSQSYDSGYGYTSAPYNPPPQPPQGGAVRYESYSTMGGNVNSPPRQLPPMRNAEGYSQQYNNQPATTLPPLNNTNMPFPHYTQSTRPPNQ